MFLLSSCVQRTPFSAPSTAVQEVKVAMILPERLIGRYAHTTSTAVFAYFLTRNHPYKLTTFQISDEEPEAIARVLDEIKEQEIDYVIAPVTPKGARVIAEQEDGLSIFFPTVHRDDLPYAADNIYFGAIDYRAQIEKLIPFASSPLVIMYDESAKGKRLLAMTEQRYLESEGAFLETARKERAAEEKVPYNAALEPDKREVIAYSVAKKRSNMKAYFQNNEKIQFGTFFLNTPIIKSTMILSQLSVYDTDVTNVLSTQINYDPLLLTMTQQKDRAKLYVANSISIQNDNIIQANTLLNNDVVYDWINYASTVGADYFYHRITGEERLYDLPVVNNQIVYPVAIVHPSQAHFKAVEERRLP